MLEEGNLDLKLSLTMADVANLDINLEGYFKLYLTMVDVDNLDTSLGGYLRLSFLMAELITFYKTQYIRWLLLEVMIRV